MKAIAILALLVSPAFAADEPRRIDFSQVLIGKDGKPFNECVRLDSVDRTKCVEEIDLTLGWISATALDQSKPGMPGAEKTKRGKLAYKVIDARESELDSKEISMIIDALDELNYRNTAIYAAKRALDPASVK